MNKDQAKELHLGYHDFIVGFGRGAFQLVKGEDAAPVNPFFVRYHTRFGKLGDLVPQPAAAAGRCAACAAWTAGTRRPEHCLLPKPAEG